MSLHGVQNNILVSKGIIGTKLNIPYQTVRPVCKWERIWILIDDITLVLIDLVCEIAMQIKAVCKSIKIHLIWIGFNLFGIKILGTHKVTNTI